MKAPAQYDPEAIRKLYNPQEIIAKEQEKQNKLKQDVINTTNQQQQKVLDQKKSTYQSYVSGPENYKDFTKEQASNNLKDQLKYQRGYLNQRGFKYQNQKDIPFIDDQIVYSLAEAGIQDLRQLGYQEVETPATIMELTKKGDKYYKTVEVFRGNKKLEEVEAFDVKETEIEERGAYGSTSIKKVIKGKVKNAPTYELINKDTGKRVVQGKYGGILAEYGKDQGFRFGNTTRTEGMTDFMIKFDKDGQALIYPRYEDTASDLTGILTVASIALAGTGVGASLGSSFLGGAGSAATQKAIGNALINATISEVTGGDFFKTFATGVAVPMVSSGMNSVLGNTIFKDLPVGDSVKRIAGSAINNSVTSGVVAAINGQNIGQAMYKGAIRGGVTGGAGIAVSKLLTEDNMKFITDNSNLSFTDVQKIGTMGISRGVNNIIQGRNFTDGIMETLVSHGVSKSVANQIGSSFKESFENNPELLSTIQTTGAKLTNLYIKSAMSGRPVSPAMLQKLLLQQALTPTLGKGIQKTKEIAKKGVQEVFKKIDPRDSIKITTNDLYPNVRND